MILTKIFGTVLMETVFHRTLKTLNNIINQVKDLYTTSFFKKVVMDFLKLKQKKK